VTLFQKDSWRRSEKNPEKEARKNLVQRKPYCKPTQVPGCQSIQAERELSRRNSAKYSRIFGRRELLTRGLDKRA